LATIHKQEFGSDAKIVSIKPEETFTRGILAKKQTRCLDRVN
jgi:hypothetical protein